jgi:hypothetical protein
MGGDDHGVIITALICGASIFNDIVLAYKGSTRFAPTAESAPA